MKNLKYILFILIFLSNIILAQRPNIVWITVEDISPTLSVYGDSTAKTPNIDRLASQSQIFTESFTTVGYVVPQGRLSLLGCIPCR